MYEITSFHVSMANNIIIAVRARDLFGIEDVSHCAPIIAPRG